MMRHHRVPLLAGVVLAVAAGPRFASSATLAAMAGHGWPNMFNTCFSSGNAQMANTCGTTQKLIIPVQTVTAGFQQASVRAHGANGLRTSCFARTIDRQNNSGDTISAVTRPDTVNVTLDLSLLQVSPGGTIHFECDVVPGGAVVNVEFHSVS